MFPPADRAVSRWQMVGCSQEGQDFDPAILTVRKPLERQIQQQYFCTIWKCLLIHSNNHGWNLRENGEMSGNVFNVMQQM